MIDFDRDVPKVELEFMNSDHAHATEITNRLIDLLDNDASNTQAIETELQALLTHCQEHFAREEEQMRQCNFPPYDCHKGEHERVLAELANELKDWQTNADVAQLNGYTHQTLLPWFINHIATMDTVTARYINSVS